MKYTTANRLRLSGLLGLLVLAGVFGVRSQFTQAQAAPAADDALPVAAAAVPDSRWFSQRTEENGYLRTIVNAIRPIDEAGNPYRGFYSDWDRWAMQNFQPGYSIQDIGTEFAYPYDPQPDENGMVRQWMDLRVDSEGWLIPWSRYLDSWTDPQLRYGDTAQDGKALAAGFAVGMIDATMYANWKLAIEDARGGNQATALPAIPAWLMQQAPLDVVFVPNGEICVKGPLGLYTAGMDHQQLIDLKARERWYRYSAEGRLLERGGVYSYDMADNAWMFMYWPGLADKLEEMAAQGLVPRWRSMGVSFTQDSSRRLRHEAEFYFDRPQYKKPEAADFVASFDYLGRPLDLEQPANDTEMVRHLDGPALSTYYKAQLSRGTAGAETVSLFEGQPEGPVRLQGAYRPPVTVDPDNHVIHHYAALLEPQALDDPGNPFAGQYGEWDRLCFDNACLRNDAMTAMFEAKHRAFEESVKQAQADGLSLDDYIAAHPKADMGLSAPELEAAGILSLSNYVDEDGWLVPASVASARYGVGQYPYIINTHVSVPQEQLERFIAWRSTQDELHARK